MGPPLGKARPSSWRGFSCHLDRRLQQRLVREPDPQRNRLLPATSSPQPGVGWAGTATGVRTFTVGFMPGLIVTAEVRALSRRHPGLSVEVLRTDWINQVTGIGDGTVDVGYLRLPFAEGQFTTVVCILWSMRRSASGARWRCAG
jgi:hypothetical protein